MGEGTKIQWCDHTFNGVRGCEHAELGEGTSLGCDHCYAEQMSGRNPRQLGVWGEDGTRVLAAESYWKNLDKWHAAAVKDGAVRRVFCYSLGDVFESPKSLVNADVCTKGRALLFAAIERLPLTTLLDGRRAGLVFLLLTKRPQNVLRMVPPAWLPFETLGVKRAWPSHVWIGTSVENQEAADERIPHLLDVPAPVRFLSLEPLLGPVDVRRAVALSGRQYGCAGMHRGNGSPDCPHTPHHHHDDRCAWPLSWYIAGGESGSKARPCEADWIRDLVRQARAAGVAPFVKQGGACFSDPVNGIAGKSLVVPLEAAPLIRQRLVDSKGGDLEELPEDLRVREFPVPALAPRPIPG